MTVRTTSGSSIGIIGAPRKAAVRSVFQTLKTVLLVLGIAVMLAASVAFGRDADPCREVYLASGLSQQQVTFDEFREISGDQTCAPHVGVQDGANEVAPRADRYAQG